MKTYRKIQAVEKSVDILEFLSDQRDPVGGSEIAAAVDLPGGTVMTHLATLEGRRLVKKDGDRYMLGPGLVGFWARDRSNLEHKIDETEAELRRLEVG